MSMHDVQEWISRVFIRWMLDQWEQFENSRKKARNQAENMGPIASVGMVVAINTSDSTFGWYGKRQGLVSCLWLANKNDPIMDCLLKPIKGVKVAYHHWEQVPVEDQTLRTGSSQWELAN